MGGDGKANMLCSWPSPIWLCQKMEENNLKWVKLFQFLFHLARLPPRCWRAWACCVTALCRLRGSPARLGGVCACLQLALAGAVWPWVVQGKCPHLLCTPTPHYYVQKACKNEHLAKKPSWFQEEVPWIYGLPFLLKYKLETSWGERFLLLFTGPGGAGWASALGLLPRPEKHFASAEWLAGLPGCCCFLSGFSFV